MEPESDDPDDNLRSARWSGSDGSQEVSADEDDLSDEYTSDPRHSPIPRSDLGSPERPGPPDWDSADEQQSHISCQEEDDIDPSPPRESPPIESPHTPSQGTPPQGSRRSERSEGPKWSEGPEGPEAPERPGSQTSPRSSRSSSSSLGRATDLTLALTLRLGGGERPEAASGSRRAESSEEGGSSQAPPASVSFGISDRAAEQADDWKWESDTDPCRPDRHRGAHARISHSESQSERHVKETKSKCKRIAQLLTDAPNPQNKGALLFKKRRQRVEKFTLVSYGTGDKLDREDQVDEESEEVRSALYNFVASSDSELEEEDCVYQQQRRSSLNWGSVGEMDALPDTKGKGVLMFEQRRKRMDQIASEHEEMRNQGFPVEAVPEPECTQTQDMYDAEEMYLSGHQAHHMDASHRQREYQENLHQMDQLSTGPRPLVPNRTARPFLGFHDDTGAAVMRGGAVPVPKKNDTRFKVAVPVNSNPYVWSPTGDIIASRDERISVPAIKTGILPESKRKGAALAQRSDPRLRHKGDRRSYIESEDDCFSLGAEACNFMQPRTMKLKNPPPVAPKPAINPNCPPWLSRSPTGEAFTAPRSPLLQQPDWAQPQQSLQTPAAAWTPLGRSPQLHAQQTTNSWSQQATVSIQARSPPFRPHSPSSPSRMKSGSVPNSSASCPPPAGGSYVHAAPKGGGAGRAVSHSSDGSLVGKGAALFAKRQSRMEKFVVDADTVQANQKRASSPTSSLPNYWRYSSNVRAPPPLSYNPLLSPFHPQPAAKQPPPPSAPTVPPKTKEKPKARAKHLNALDIMKHQPYQLDSSLFKYDAVPCEAPPEPKSPSPSPGPKPSSRPTPASKFEQKKNLKLRALSSHSTQNQPKPEPSARAEAGPPARPPGSGSGRSRSLSLPRRPTSAPVIPLQRSFSKPPSPWEAATRSPLGLVDEAFPSRGPISSCVASQVRAAAGQRQALPEPPDEWKRRVSLDPPVAWSRRMAPAGAPTPGGPAFCGPPFYGPPFRTARPLGPGSRAGFMGPDPTRYSALCGAVPRSYCH